MLGRQIQIEKEIDELLDADIENDRLYELMDELEELLADKFNGLRLVE